MWFKLYEEEGNYLDVTTNEPRNLLYANDWVETPEGPNVGWTELNSLEEAIQYFNLKEKE